MNSTEGVTGERNTRLFHISFLSFLSFVCLAIWELFFLGGGHIIKGNAMHNLILELGVSALGKALLVFDMMVFHISLVWVRAHTREERERERERASAAFIII